MAKREQLSDWLGSDFIPQLLEHLPVNVFWKNKKGVYLGCNVCFARSIGLSSPQEIIGKTDYDLPVRKEDSDSYRQDDKQVMQSRQPKLNIEEEQTLNVIITATANNPQFEWFLNNSLISFFLILISM